jgi:hypothetical protein
MTRLLALASAALFLTGSAAADGLPVLGVDVGSKGVAGRYVRYVTLPEPGPSTLVARTSTSGGRVLRYTRVEGRFTIPAVAYDGTAGGLSSDGGTLVLIEPRRTFPRATSRFAVLDAKRLSLTKRITLRGDFSFDAISPEGRVAYLIQYVAPQDPSRYLVRALDLRTGRLDPNAIVDPRDEGEKMRGAPITRLTSPTGRWAYTLYDGAGATPFVHALDTSRRAARCIDLPRLEGRQDLWQLRLSLRGKQLAILSPTRTIAFVSVP